MKIYISLVLLFNLLFSSMILADEYAEDRHQMKMLLGKIVQDLNSGSIDNFDQYLSADAVVTFYDGRYATGIPAIKKYMQTMLTGDNPVLKKITTTAEETTEAKVYPNNTAIAYGWLKNNLVFIGGKSMQVDGRWTTSLIKEKDHWKIISLHFSTNIFDNAILNEAKNKLWVFSAIALVIGFALGWLVNRSRISS